MSILADKQARFLKMTTLLKLRADLEGDRLRYGEAHRWLGAPHGSPTSLHPDRLALDVMLDKLNENGNWIYQEDTEAYEYLGEFWESIGGAWGGRFLKPDGNHFSLEHGGRR